jgi:hypothetical protein
MVSLNWCSIVCAAPHVSTRIAVQPSTDQPDGNGWLFGKRQTNASLPCCPYQLNVGLGKRYAGGDASGLTVRGRCDARASLSRQTARPVAVARHDA